MGPIRRVWAICFRKICAGRRPGFQPRTCLGRGITPWPAPEMACRRGWRAQPAAVRAGDDSGARQCLLARTRSGLRGGVAPPSHLQFSMSNHQVRQSRSTDDPGTVDFSRSLIRQNRACFANFVVTAAPTARYTWGPASDPHDYR
jgi:hypothetical protein